LEKPLFAARTTSGSFSLITKHLDLMFKSKHVVNQLFNITDPYDSRRVESFEDSKKEVNQKLEILLQNRVVSSQDRPSKVMSLFQTSEVLTKLDPHCSANVLHL
jgi:hypothetical protein